MAPNIGEGQVSPDFEASSSDFYTNFIKESHRAPGDHGIHPDKVQEQNEKELNDPELLAQGQEYVRRNFLPIVLSHFIFMMWVFGSKYARILIHHTGGSTEKFSSLKRYLATILRMTQWYEGDFSKPFQGSNKDLVTVRKIHGLAAKLHPTKPTPELPPLTKRQKKIYEALKKEVATIDVSNAPPYIFQTENPELPLSQFHMTMGQWGFMGLIVAYPEVFGVHDTTGVEGYVHMWAIIARQLGIEDRFNLALQLKRKGMDTTELKKIYENVARPLLKPSDEWTVILLEAMIEGVGEYVGVVKLMPFLKYMVVALGMEGKSFDSLMSWSDRLIYWFSTNVILPAGKFRFTNWLRNIYVRWCFGRGQRLYLGNKKW